MSTDNAKAYIFAHPDLKVTPALLFWLLDTGFRRENITFIRGQRDICTMYNLAVSMALESDADEFLFADNDVHPHPKLTQPFLEATDKDFLCVEYDNGCGATWANPAAFHCGMWRTNRAALERVGLPAFQWPRNATHTQETGCCCTYFAKRAAKLGLKTGHAGSMGHAPKIHGKDGVGKIAVFGK